LFEEPSGRLFLATLWLIATSVIGQVLKYLTRSSREYSNRKNVRFAHLQYVCISFLERSSRIPSARKLIIRRVQQQTTHLRRHRPMHITQN